LFYDNLLSNNKVYNWCS